MNAVRLERQPVEAHAGGVAMALPSAAATGLYGLSLIDLAPIRPERIVTCRRTTLRCAECRRRTADDSRGSSDWSTRPSSSITISSYSAAPSDCATPPSIWPRHCIGLATRPASAACTLFRMWISPLTLVHRDAKALHVERDRARRAVGGAVALRTTPAMSRRWRSSASAIDCRRRSTASSPSVQSARGTLLCSAAKSSSSSRSASAARLRRAAGDERAGRAIGAGVVAAMRGVGLRQADAIDGVVPSAVAAICRCTVLVPLPNSAVPTVRSKPPSARSAIVASAIMPARRHGIDHGQRDAFADQPFRRQRRRRRRRLHRALDQIEALVEAVAAIDHVVMVEHAAATIIGSPGFTTLRRRNSNGSMPSCAREFVDRRLRPRTASAAGRSRETRRPARCWYRRR